MYKLSKYNVMNTYLKDVYLWNTFSGALISLDKNGVEYIQNFSGENDDDLKFSLLKDHGFIVDENIDETGFILSCEKSSLFSMTEETMYVVISLGLGCNYNCTYCFQNNHNNELVMDAFTANDVAEYICKKIESQHNLKKVNLKWFGGEPLLYMNTLEMISKKIIQCTQNLGVEYVASIITNGRFLNEYCAKKLKNLMIKRAQITLDGLCENYCRSKCATEKDFYEVIKNLKETAPILNITVRLNIPDNNAEEAIRVTDYLLTNCMLNGKIKIYFAFIKMFQLSKEEGEQGYIRYVDNYIKWLKYVLHKYGYVVAKGTYPLRKLTSCGYIRAGSICINYNGKLFKCESCFDLKDKVIGDIWRGRYYNKMENNYQKTIDKRKGGMCLKCSVLPICMGGCINDEINSDYEMECKAYKKMLFTLKLAEGGILL